MENDRTFGMGAGDVFPEASARSLLNPVRRLVQSPLRTVASMQLAADAEVLEIGSGPGFFSPSLQAAIPNGHLVLYDLQAGMLEMAGPRLRTPRPGFVQGDATLLPFADASFDAVFIATMLGEVPDPAAAVAEARRCLRSGGTLSIAETRRDSDFIALDDLRALVEPRGFGLDRRSGVRLQYVAHFVAA